MSELLPESQEEERLTKLSCASGEYDVYPSQATIYTHLGKLAMYDHIFINLGDNKNLYWWRFNPSTGQEEERQQKVQADALEQHSQAFLNLRKVADKDVEMYVRHSSNDLGDTMPEGWE